MIPRHPRRILASATAILTTIALAACGGASGGGAINAQDHTNFFGGCTENATKAMCECVFANLTTKQGINTEAKFQVLEGNEKKLLALVQASALACKSA
jgi:hypothetical protein